MAIDRDIGKRLDSMLPPVVNAEEGAPFPFNTSVAPSNVSPMSLESPNEPGEGVQVASLTGGLAKLSQANKMAKAVQKAAAPAMVSPIERAAGKKIVEQAPKPMTLDEMRGSQESVIGTKLSTPVVIQGDDVVTSMEAQVAADVAAALPTTQTEQAAKTAPVQIEPDGTVRVEPAPQSLFNTLQKRIGLKPNQDGMWGFHDGINLSKITSSDEVKALMVGTLQTYRQMVDAARQKGRTLEDMAREGLQVGDDEALKMVLQRQPGDRPFTDAETVAVGLMRVNLAEAVNTVIKRALTSGNPLDVQEALRAQAFFGYIMANVSGNSTAASHSLAAHKIIVAPNPQNVAAMQRELEKLGMANPATFSDVDNPMAVINDLGGMEVVRNSLRNFSRLNTAGQKAFYSQTVLRKGLDSAAEVYQSAILSNPVTQMFNVAGTPIHYALMQTERSLAALYQGDVAKLTSMLAGLRAIPRYLKQSMSAANRAWSLEQSADQAAKWDGGVSQAVSASNFGLRPDSGFAIGVDLLGTALRTPGFRLLTTADDFFKSFIRGIELEMAAVEEQTNVYRSLMAAGKTSEEAYEGAAQAYQRVLESPAAYDEASRQARIAAFQDELPYKWMRDVEPFAAHPIVKLFTPLTFYKTPAQIVMRTLERAPVINMVMPESRKAAKAIAQDIGGFITRRNASEAANLVSKEEKALFAAKVTTGIMLAAPIWALGSDDEDVIITGYGPTNPGKRRIWLESNAPYSFGIKQYDKDGKWNGKRTFVSYERYDPFSGLLALHADTKPIVLEMFETNPKAAEDLVINLSLATSRYMLNAQPMLKSWAELVDATGNRNMRADEGKQAARILEILRRRATDNALVVGQSVATFGMGTQSMAAYMQRYLDPNKKSTLPIGSQMEYGGDWDLTPEREAIAMAKARNPLFSDELTYKLNEWGEREPTDVTAISMFLPVKIMERKYNPINAELEMLGAPLPLIRRYNMGESGLELNNEQSSRFVELVNNPKLSKYWPYVRALRENIYKFDADGKPLPGQEPLPKEALDLAKSVPERKQSLLNIITTPGNEYNSEMLDENGQMRYMNAREKLAVLSKEHARYVNWAKRLMFYEYPDLQELVNQRDMYMDANINAPTHLPLRPEEYRDALERNRKFESGVID